MKRFIVFLVAISSALFSFAQLTGDGFYRIRNYGTGYYIWVCDNTGSINYVATTADMGALQLWPELDNAISEPASVLYMTHVGGEKWDAKAQGTGVYKMIQHYLQVRTLGVAGSNTLYEVYATEAGMTIYLSDVGGWGGDYHSLGTTEVLGKTAKRWIAEPIDANTDNYFGVTPSVVLGDKYYAPFYADFAFSFASAGMKAFTISAVDNGIAIIKPIETEVVPASTPVIIECSSADKSDNRLNLLAGSYPAVANNKLAGVYFCNEFREKSKDAITPFDASTMRVLYVNAEGKLVFGTQTTNLHINWYGDDGKRYLNANQSYLPVSTDAPAELTIMTEAEYAEYKANLKYTVTFMVDGQVYQTSELKEGEAITPASAPVKEGYTFSGWSEVPTTMPAHDVVVSGSFSVNSYKLTYQVDGTEYKTLSVNYGVTLSPEEAPVKEGYTFSGWTGLPAAMPANDVVVTGTFSVNSYKVTFMYGDNVLKTITVEYGASIPLPTSLDSERYTLVEWLEVPTTMPAHDVTIYANYVDGISIVETDRAFIRRVQLNGVSTNTPMKGIYIIRMSDGSTKKVMVK
ncbi:MAG: InlB B-repeat-containing protein [Bacteroidaceae bacterium]|nr:InlB B-repeat-containing protein [Bacteroidaceae bacterium]